MFTLPLSQSVQKTCIAACSRGRSPKSPERKLMQVLIVDDDADIREVARLSLELVGGWTVFVAEAAPMASSKQCCDRLTSSCST